MKLLDSYMLRRIGSPYAYLLTAFCMIFVIFDLFQNLSEFIEASTPLPMVFKYYAFLLPSLAKWVTPISILLAALYTLWQLTKRNELNAMRASGVSFVRIMRPIMILGLASSLSVLAINEAVEPDATQWADKFIRNLKKGGEVNTHILEQVNHTNEKARRVWNIVRLDIEAPYMHGIQIDELRTNNSVKRKISAKEGEWVDGVLFLYSATVSMFGEANNPMGAPSNMPVMECPDFTETPDDLAGDAMIGGLNQPTFFSAAETWRYIRNRPSLEQKTRNNLLVDLHFRLAMPWTSMIVALFGIPFGVYIGRRDALVGVISALLVFFGFYFLMSFSIWLGKHMVLPPVLCAWLPNAAVLGSSVAMVMRLR